MKTGLIKAVLKAEGTTPLAMEQWIKCATNGARTGAPSFHTCAGIPSHPRAGVLLRERRSLVTVVVEGNEKQKVFPSFDYFSSVILSVFIQFWPAEGAFVLLLCSSLLAWIFNLSLSIFDTKCLFISFARFLFPLTL